MTAKKSSSDYRHLLFVQFCDEWCTCCTWSLLRNVIALGDDKIISRNYVSLLQFIFNLIANKIGLLDIVY